MMKKRLRLLCLFLMMGLLVACTKKNPGKEGLAYLEEGNYESAIEEFEKAVEKEVNVGDAYRGIGLAKWEMGDYEGAAAAFESALQNGTKETATIYNLLGLCKLNSGSYESGIQYFEQGIDLGEGSGELMKEMRYNQIAAFEKKGDFESAKVKLASYIADYPEDEKAKKEHDFLETR